jgi:hypothetical protein
MGGALTLDNDLAAILGDKGGLVAVNIRAADQLLEDAPAFVLATFINDVHEPHVFEVFVAVAQDLFPGPVGVEEGAVRPDAVDKVLGVFNQGAIELNILFQHHHGLDAGGGLLLKEFVFFEQVFVAGLVCHIQNSSWLGVVCLWMQFYDR